MNNQIPKDRSVLAAPLPPARLQRMANVALNRLGHQAIDVDVEPRADGRVAIILSEAWAYLFLAHLEAQAKQIHEQVRRAAYEARMKDARLQTELHRAAAEWEQEKSTIHARYRELVAGGLAKRDAIRKIKSENPGMSATYIQGVIEGRDPRNPRKPGRKKRDADDR